MGFLQDKKILITGLLSKRSIAYGIAQACKREGAQLAFTYTHDRFKQRIINFANEFESTLIFQCDVNDDTHITNLFTNLNISWDYLDGLVHAIGFSPNEVLSNNFLTGLSRENFSITHNISSYSFSAMAKAALPLLKYNSALLTLTYLGAKRAIANYNIMGLAKASLEASVRYLAETLGPQGIRVNSISAGPIKTIAASGIKNFHKIFDLVSKNAPLRRNITSIEIGNTAAFLLSNLASGITGQTIYVDGGFSRIISGFLDH